MSHLYDIGVGEFFVGGGAEKGCLGVESRNAIFDDLQI